MWEQLMWALQLTTRCAFGCWLAKGSRETENWEPFHLLGQFRTDEQNYLVFGRKTLLNIILAYLNMAFPILPKKPRWTLPAEVAPARMISLATPQKSSGQFCAAESQRSLTRTKPFRLELPESMTSNSILPDWISSEESKIKSDFKETMMLGYIFVRFWEDNCLKEIDASLS